MKKLLIGAAALAAVAAYAISANAAQQTINLSGTVAAFCTINGSASPAALTPSFPTVTDGNVPDGVATDISIGTVICNNKADVTLASSNGAAIGPANSNSSFQNYVNYKASVSAPASVLLEANSTTGGTNPLSATAQSAGASSGTVSVHLEAVGNAKPLVAGSYNDVLTVTIVPGA